MNNTLLRLSKFVLRRFQNGGKMNQIGGKSFILLTEMKFLNESSKLEACFFLNVCRTKLV